MEVSGKITSPSKQILYCVPCGRDYLNKSVHGYCQDCQEHLCKCCFQHHRKSRPCRNHVLLDQNSMPLQPTIADFNDDVIIDTCPNHKDKLLEFYCNDHESVACYVCVTVEHKQCKVDYIPEVSGSMSVELKDLITRMQALVKNCESNIQKAQDDTQQLDKNHENVVKDIKLFRNEINAALDEMETRVLKETRSFVTEAKRKMQNVNDVCIEIADELKSSLSSFDTLSKENKRNKLFVEMKNSASRVESLSDKEKQTIENNETDDHIDFFENRKILEHLQQPDNNFGMISTSKKPSADLTLCFKYESDMNMNMSSDKELCDVRGMVMISTKRIMVSDFNNNKIKMIDVVNGALLSEKTLSSRPYDIIKLPNNKLAVTLPFEKCIQIMSYTDTSMSSERRINVREECYCVAYCHDKLVVGCNVNPGKLIILNLDGNIIQVFDTPGLFAGPRKIIISSNEKFLYVSDSNNKIDSCMKIDWQGNIVGRFERPGYRGPRGIQELEDGTLLVIYFNSDNIVRLSSCFERCEIEGLENTNLYGLWALVYDERDHKLYVSGFSDKTVYKNETVMIFNVKWRTKNERKTTMWY